MGWKDAPEVAPSAASRWSSAPEVGGEPAAPTPPRVPRTSIWDAITSAAGQGALGLGDELGAGVQALLAAGTRGGPGVADTYLEARRDNRQIRDASWDQHPWAYAGGYVPALAASMAVPMGGVASLVGKGSGIPRAIGRAFLAGAPQGAAAAFGNSEADLTRNDWGGLGGDLALGGIGGGALGVGMLPVAKAANWAAPKVANFAYRQAVRAAGPLKGDVLALLKSGRLEAVGKKLMEMGIIPKGSGIDTIAGLAESATEETGPRVGATLRELDGIMPALPSAPARLGAGANPPVATTPNGLTGLPPALEGRPFGDLPGSLELRATADTVNRRAPGLDAVREAAPTGLPGFNPYQAAQRARAELLEPMRSQPAQQDLIPFLQRHIENLEDLGNQRVTFQRANDIKRGYDTRIKNWNKDQSETQGLLKQLRGLVNGEIESSADRAVSMTGNGDLADRFRAAKADHHDLSAVAEFARKAAAGQEARSPLSLFDVIAGISPAATALAAGHPMAALGGLATALGSKLARERGPSLAAHGALSLSQLLARSGPAGSSWAGRAVTSLPGRRAETLQALLDLLAPSTLRQPAPSSSPLSPGRAALLGLDR